MSRLLLVLITAVLVVLPVAPVAAHSLLLASSPAAGATVAGEPGRLMLRFNNRIEKRLSRVRLVDARGEKRALDVKADDLPVEELHASIPALAPGDYRVEWQVLSTDGHVVNGAFSFRVASEGGPVKPALEAR